jgi:predicted dehydrogenase
MSRLLKVGLVGSGIGRRHLAAFASLPSQFQVMAVCDIDPSRAGTLAAQYDVPRVVTDVTDLCRMDNVDVIDLCTPSFLH